MTGKLMADASLNPTSLVVVGIASAFALSSVLYIAWDISGGNVNPAVTFTMAAVGGHNRSLLLGCSTQSLCYGLPCSKGNCCWNGNVFHIFFS